MKYIKVSYSELAWIIHKLSNFQFLRIKPIQEVIHFLINKMPAGDTFTLSDDLFIQDSIDEDIFYKIPQSQLSA